MSEEPKYFNWIEEYLEGDMPDQEKLHFEAELKFNSDLAEEFKLFQSIGKGVKEHYTDDLRNKFRSIDDQLGRKDKKKLPTFRYNLAIAASLIILIISGVVLYQIFGVLSPPEEVALRFWEEDPGLPVLMGTSSSELDKVMNLYKQERYEEALGLLEQLQISQPTDDTVNYYIGILKFNVGSYMQSKNLFKKVSENLSSDFREKAQYRYGLTLLMTDESKAAKRIFQNIASNNNHLYHQQAKEILKNIKQ